MNFSVPNFAISQIFLMTFGMHHIPFVVQKF